MKKRSRLVRLLSGIFKIRTWFDWERVKAFTLYLGNGLKRLFIPKQPAEVESFEEAMKKLNLNDADIRTKQKSLFRMSIIMVLSALMIFSYAGYQLFEGSIKAFIVSLIVTLIAMVLAFRYHFWYYQMKQRKLGCTFNEWYRKGLLGEKK